MRERAKALANEGRVVAYLQQHADALHAHVAAGDARLQTYDSAGL